MCWRQLIDIYKYIRQLQRTQIENKETSSTSDRFSRLDECSDEDACRCMCCADWTVVDHERWWSTKYVL